MGFEHPGKKKDINLEKNKEKKKHVATNTTVKKYIYIMNIVRTHMSKCMCTSADKKLQLIFIAFLPFRSYNTVSVPVRNNTHKHTLVPLINIYTCCCCPIFIWKACIKTVLTYLSVCHWRVFTSLNTLLDANSALFCCCCTCSVFLSFTTSIHTCLCRKRKKNERTEAHLKMRQERKRGEKTPCRVLLSFFFFQEAVQSLLPQLQCYLKCYVHSPEKKKKSRESADLCIERGQSQKRRTRMAKNVRKTVQGHKKRVMLNL